MIRRLAVAVLALAGAAPALAASLVFVTPIDIDAHYPPRALDNNIEGAADIRCTLKADGWLDGCAVLSEQPPGYGFGKAAVRMLVQARIDIQSSGLANAVGQAIRVPIKFRLADPPPPASEPVVASADGETPPPPEGEYEDHADGRQFVEGVELGPEDRAARQVHSSTPADTGCPEQSGCLAAN